MGNRNPDPSSTRRVSTSDDLEVSTYLEIAQENTGAQPQAASTEKPTKETIGVIDFGSQYSLLIARRIRECHVYSTVIPHNTPWEEVAKLNLKGIVLSGGPASVYDSNAPMAPSWVYEKKLPLLGICYGMQVIAHQLGGAVASIQKREYGHAILHQNAQENPLFDRLPTSMPVWMSHGDQITQLPSGFHSLAYTDSSPIAAFGDLNHRYGLQFHPEVTHTPQGTALLRNFLYQACGCSPTWTPTNFLEESIANIKDQVGAGKAICALSGGVDSAVTAALIHRAVGNQLTCIFVDNGLLRLEEAERVVKTFKQHLGMNLIHVDARKRFLQHLSGVTDPEKKRRVIGEVFIRVFEEEARQLGQVDFLAQGTLYPDVIESQSTDNQVSAKIKTHHNVGGLPPHMDLTLIEPLRYLFKDETREIGIALGLPEEIVFRQPFPGPGLAIRIVGEITEEKLDVLRQCDWIVMDEIKAAKLYRQLWQSFAVLTDTRSVGVMGDFRTYGNVIAIRAVTSDDAMTADWARLPYEILGRISNRIVNEVPQANRVVYDITSKPPGTIEWE